MNATEVVKTPQGRKLKPHDGATEWYVCRECGHMTDLAVVEMPKADADEAKCAGCGRTDTAWLYA